MGRKNRTWKSEENIKNVYSTGTITGRVTKTWLVRMIITKTIIHQKRESE